jgi:Rps23 Pro-64 3,4-dihydroxylase Tpa1-like proline 4-hydroxylase
MEMKDLIRVYPNNLTPEFCQHIIQKFESDDKKGPGKVIGDGSDSESCIQSEYKMSTDLYITKWSDWKNEDDTFYDSLRQPLINYIKYCDSINPEIVMGLENKLCDSGYQIQRTRPGEHYTWHQDWHYDMKHGYRVFTYIWYLNDVHHEGETEFIDGTKIKPEQGKLLFFPATWTYVHRGVSPKCETKYICTGWIHCKFDF